MHISLNQTVSAHYEKRSRSFYDIYIHIHPKLWLYGVLFNLRFLINVSLICVLTSFQSKRQLFAWKRTKPKWQKHFWSWMTMQMACKCQWVWLFSLIVCIENGCKITRCLCVSVCLCLSFSPTLNWTQMLMAHLLKLRPRYFSISQSKCTSH